jgi:hypothetical protein
VRLAERGGMSKQRSARQWAAIIRSYRGSGLTQVEFCRRKGLALSTLTYHLRRDAGPEGQRSEAGDEAAPKLLELELAVPSLPTATVVIEVPWQRGEGLRIHCHCRQTGEVLRQIPGLLPG